MSQTTQQLPKYVLSLKPNTLSKYPKILYIEDTTTLPEWIEPLTSENNDFGLNWHWTHQPTLQAGLNALLSQSFDAIAVHLFLPDSQGLETFNRLRAVVCDLPMMIISTTTPEELALARECIHQGATDYCLKPNPDTEVLLAQELLVRILRNVEERQQIEQELQQCQTDIREHQRFEQHLRTSYTQIKGFLAAINDTVLILDLEANDIQVVPTHLRVSEQTGTDVLNHTLNLLTNSQQSQSLLEAIAQSLTNQTSVNVEYSLTINDQQLWFTADISPLSEEQVIWVARDITQRKQAEAKLQQQLTAIEAAIDGIAVLKNGQYIYLNPAHVKLFGYNNPEELIGKSWTAFYSADEIERFQQDVFPLLGKNPAWRGEAIATRKDGSTFPEDISLTLAPDGTLICVCRDITQRKQAEQEIFKALEKEKELNQLKSRFITLMSHEFRTPLAVISSSAGILETFNHKLSEEKKQKHIHKIKTQIQHSIQLLDEILLINQVETNPLTFNPKPLNLVDFCQGLIFKIQHSHDNTHPIKLSYPQNHQAFKVMIDQTLLEHILTELLSNAIKYSPNRGKIDLRLSFTEDHLCFQVQDQGIGIPSSDQEYLFQSFYRAENVRMIQGTGLGLSIIKQCIDAYGGQIRIESAVNQGTSVTITLPFVLEKTP